MDVLRSTQPLAPALLERLYDAPEMVAQRKLTIDAIAPRRGETGFELGSGPGHLACELADLLGPTGTLIAMDRDAEVVARAEALAGRCSRTKRPIFVLGEAGAVPLETASCHFAVAVQVLSYMKDVPAALAELHRILRPGGRVVILDTRWDSLVWKCDDEARGRRVQEAYASRLVDSRLPMRLQRLMRDAGLERLEERSIPIVASEHDESKFHGVLLLLMLDYVRRKHPDLVADAEAWAKDLEHRSDIGKYSFRLERYQFVGHKKAT